MRRFIIEKLFRLMASKSSSSAHRFFYKVSGFTDRELKNPIIAIANTTQEAGVGHMHLKQLAEAVKAGIYSAGGTPIEFNTIGPCGGYARDTEFGWATMLYDLPQRDVIADSVEVQLRNYGADGLVCIGTCDKSIPGLWLGAARLNLPTIFLTGGPALPGEYEGECTVFPTDVILGSLKAVLEGEKSLLEMLKDNKEMEGKWILTCGACPELTTANTVQMATEAMGLCIPGSSTMPGFLNEKIRVAKETGYAIVEMVKKRQRFSDFVTRESIMDAARMIFAVSGGTNGLLHLLSLAKYMGIDVDLDTFDRLSATTPYICPIRPAGNYTMIDLHYAGGVFGILKRLQDFIHPDRPVVTGDTTGRVIDNWKIESEAVIRKISEPIRPAGSILVLRGNLAPRGALCRPAVVRDAKERFEGTARVFDGQHEALRAVVKKEIKEGEVVVIRFEGPRGGPGFSEDFRVVLLLETLGYKNVAVVTDSRFSGVTKGLLYVGYVCPEAYIGGPLAALKDGDRITIDLKEKRVDVALSDEEIKNRLTNFKPPVPRIKEGILVDWHLLATQFDEGAMLKRKL
jgi:dihydroxy-acid dehydratase